MRDSVCQLVEREFRVTVSHRVSVSVTLTVLLRQVSAASPDSRYAGGSHDPPPPPRSRPMTGRVMAI